MFMLKSKLEKQLTSALYDVFKFIGIGPNDPLALSLLGEGFIAGGAITSAIAGLPPKDLDFFFENKAVAKTFIDKLLTKINALDQQAKLQLEEIKEDDKQKGLFRGCLKGNLSAANKVLAANKGATPIQFVSCNAITFSNGLQFIFRFIGKPEIVFTTFDFEHCKVYYKLSAVDTGYLVFEGQSAQAIATKTLVYTGNSRFVCSAIHRLTKFAKRGWVVSPQAILELIASSYNINWSSVEAVKEELSGFYAIKPDQVDYILNELKQKENFSIKEVTELLEGL